MPDNQDRSGKGPGDRAGGGRARARPEGLEDLQQALRYRFRDPGLLDRALTHRSYAHEKGGSFAHSELLEFLGDAVLSLGVSQSLCARFPEAQVGDLARARAYLVSEPSLARKARLIGIGLHLRLGRGEERGGGREKDSLLADAYEAVLGAIYLDGGLAEAVAAINRSFAAQIARIRPETRGRQDAKTDLQEALQAAGLPVPRYRVGGESGPDHRKSFSIELTVLDRVVARGAGSSKKAAEQAAARQALKRVDALIAQLKAPADPGREGPDRSA